MSGLLQVRGAVSAFAAAAIVIAACGGGGFEAGDTPPSGEREAVSSADTSASDSTAPAAESVVENSEHTEVSDTDSVIEIDIDGASAFFDRRLLGTNIPAWLGPERLLDPDFQTAALESGTTLVRMPGGSWSNSYDWAACEIDDEEHCFWTWAASPSDFAQFMADTDLAGIWTVSINHTAQSAAAAVAFFNGDVSDQTVIGVDRNGVDWGTVSLWANLRANRGHPDPVRIELWEVGNEVYGGKKESGGPGCKSWGWEDVWTCDGTEYVNGNASHDGYLATRAAMLAVDPTIEIGAVGVPKPDDWNNWGNEVIEAAEGELDFYIVHQYGFESSPGVEAALRRPSQLWPEVVNGVRGPLGNNIPIALTEYNLVAVETRDTEQTMTQAVNALYIAESIGQLATLGVSIANQWNLANGTAANGTDYGLISADDGSRYPQFEALATWGRAGTRLLQSVSPTEGVKIYPTIHDDGTLTLIVVGRSSEATTWTVDILGLDSGARVITRTAATDDPTATAFDISDDTFDISDSSFEFTVPAYSISSIDVRSAA